MPDETAGTLKTGGLIVIQKKKGYRFSVDSYLLAAFVDECEGSRVVEIGSGSGVVSILLAGIKKLNMTGVEIQSSLAEMSQRSIEINKLRKQLNIIHADIKNFRSERFDAVVANPPYRPVGSGRINPKDEKALARHELSLSLEELLYCSNRLLNDSGRFYAIYPAWRLPDMICSMRASNIEPKRIVMVHSHYQSRASLFLIEGVKGAGKEMFLEPPLYIYESENKYTGIMEDLFVSLRLGNK